MEKYLLKNEAIYITASFLDIRTKLFGRVDEKLKKEYTLKAYD